ncbi:hypothetical protein [Sinomonas mesophila]|uniref:hypothetical protein n=1 Tax=Sinomonas mesophila TaxID=1531955 RepID=UPI00098492F9|nr:hypothetical protein [Sinomonas mesophila]
MTSETHHRVRRLTDLHRGELIEARSGRTVLRGTVYDTAPGVGVVWIKLEDSRQRRAIQAEDFALWHVASGRLAG